MDDFREGTQICDRRWSRFKWESAAAKKDIIIRGVLSVTVVSAEGLPATDIMGKLDPFVVLPMKKFEHKNKTRVLNDTLNPVWNQTFDFVVEDGLHELLLVDVYDHDTFGKVTRKKTTIIENSAELRGKLGEAALISQVVGC